MHRTLLLPILLAACGGTAPQADRPTSRGLRASEHVAAAHVADARARDAVRWPDTRLPDATGRTDQLLQGTTFGQPWTPPAVPDREAALHRGIAAGLHAAYVEACGTRSASVVAISPLVRYGVGGAPTEDGVVLYLDAAAGSPARVLADLRCHRAWMMLGPSEMDDCPLDLPGLAIDTRGSHEGITVHMTVHDPALLPELQRRAAHDLEVGARLRDRPASVR